MPSGRRRITSRSSILSVRVSSYRPSDARPGTSAPAKPSPVDRAAILAQRKTSQRRIALQEPLPASMVTAERISLTLPVPPSINHQYATVNGRRLLSSAGRAYKAQVGQQVWVALSQSRSRASVVDRLQSEPLVLSIRFFFTSALRRDVDGGLKIAQDALCEGLGLNDNRIIETHLYKHVDRTHPRIEVTLSPVSEYPPYPAAAR
ncbi:MAG: RusA family crossover junction endodeoxyribonuclease [Nitrospiraceae bacterium]